MPIPLKQSTTVTLRVGPFLDVGGNEKTGLTPTFEVSKNNAAFGARNSATAPAHDSNAWYSVELNTTDTGTPGRLILKADDSANHLPVWHEFEVLTAAEYERRINGEDTFLIRRGQCQAGSTSLSCVMDTGASTIDNFYLGMTIAIVGGTGAGQSRYCGGYTGATRTASVQPAWVTTPDATSIFRVINAARVDLQAWQGFYPLPLDTFRVVARVEDASATSLNATNLYSRIGAPAGASVSADVAAVKSDTGTLTGRLTAARAGYLDNLNVGGNVASSSEVTAIQNNTRVVRVVPAVIERPDSGTQTYRVELYLYDETGNMEAPDSAPTIALVNQSGTDRSSRLDSTTMALVETGRYRAIYTASPGDAMEQLVWAFSVVEGGATRKYGNESIIVDTTAVDFTSADRAELDAIYSRIPGTIQPQSGDAYARLGVPSGASIAADIAAVRTAVMASVLVDTTIATVSSQTDFTLTAGSPDDNAYFAHDVIVHDAVTAEQKAVMFVSTYTASTKRLTVVAATSPAGFVLAPGDRVVIKASTAMRATVHGRTLDVSSAGNAGIDWANVTGPTTPVALTATTIGAVSGLTPGNLDATVSSRATPADVLAQIVSALASARLNELMTADCDGPLTAGSLLADLVEELADAWRFKAAALSQAPSGGGGSVSVVMGPLVGVREPGNRIMSPMALEMWQNQNKRFDIAVLDANNNPVTLTGKTLRFVVGDTQAQPVGKFDVEAAGITINANVATVTVPAQSTASTERQWWLWSLNDPTSGQHTVLAWGPFAIRPAVLDVP